MLLVSMSSTTTLTSCQDDTIEEKQVINAQAMNLLNNSTDLQSLDNISYEVPFEVKAKGDWRIDFDFEDGTPFCYAYPKQGKGDTTIKICVLDNATDEKHTGEMTITDFGDNARKTVVKIGQKSQLEGTRADKLTTGNRIYGIGYGYNAITNEVANNQIVAVSKAITDGKIVTSGVDATYKIRNYTGSCFSQLCNGLKADAKFNGKYFGFEAEAGANFEAKAFQESNNDYIINMIDVTMTKAHLEYDTQKLMEDDVMTDAAYNALNGLSYTTPKGRKIKTPYPSNNEGFKHLIKDYGTHLLRRADLGGKMKYSTTIDLSKVENEYTLNAYAKCSYKNKFIKAQANVSDDLSKQYSCNKEAIKTVLTIKGGSQANITSLQAEDSDGNMQAWLKSLQEKENLVVVNLPEADLLPLWELVSEDEDRGDKKGSERKRLLKEYMENGQMQRDFAADNKGITQQMGQMAHITGLDKMIQDSNDGTLIKDLYIGSTKVARVCSEFIPKFSTTERSIVIYPVSDNWAKYNMGFFIGNKAWRPQYICWKNEGDPIITPVEDTKPGQMTELYLSGSSFYAPSSPVVTEAKEMKADVTVKDAFLLGQATNAEGNEYARNYPIVKIFNRIWLRTSYNHKINNHVGFYLPNDTKSFPIKNWHVAQVDDFKNLMNGLTNNNISLPVLYMSNVENGKDLTGFNTEWEGWFVWTKKDAGFKMPVIGGALLQTISRITNAVIDAKCDYYWKHDNGSNNNQMEFMTCSKDGKYGHVRMKKSGSMEIVENEYYNGDWWLMQVRMVQPLNVKTK
jgi:hypothetical protein